MEKEIKTKKEIIEDEIKEETKEIVKVVKKRTAPKFNESEYALPTNAREKCRIRTAKKFNLSIDHIQAAYYDLAGKKIDGFFINELIDRLGFSDGILESRTMITKRLDLGQKAQLIDVAEHKLKKMLSSINPLKEYGKYINDVQQEFSKGLNDKAVYGE